MSHALCRVIPACRESSPPTVSPPRVPVSPPRVLGVLPACPGSSPPAVDCPQPVRGLHLPACAWIVPGPAVGRPACRGSSPPAVGSSPGAERRPRRDRSRLPWIVRLPWSFPPAVGHAPACAGGWRPRLPWLVPPRAVGRPRLTVGRPPPAVVHPRVPWVVLRAVARPRLPMVRPPRAGGSSPCAVGRPRLPSFVPTRPWFLPSCCLSSCLPLATFVLASPHSYPISYIVSRVSGLP